jgi:hypothetical protein
MMKLSERSWWTTWAIETFPVSQKDQRAVRWLEEPSTAIYALEGEYELSTPQGSRGTKHLNIAFPADCTHNLHLRRVSNGSTVL